MRILVFLLPATFAFSSPASFIPWEVSSSADRPSFLAAADMNGNGQDELICTAWNDSMVIIYENPGDSWTGTVVADDFPGASSAFAGDIDGDGFMDIAGTSWHAGELRVWYGDGAGSFTEQTVATGLTSAHEVTGSDMNTSGCIDLVTAVAGTGTISVWYNGGGALPSWTEQVVSSDMAGARSVAIGDFDGDGLPDIAGAALVSDCVRWWRNTGGETPMWEEHSLTESYNGAHMVRCGDIDGDGLQDIAAVAFFAGGIRAWPSSMGFQEFTIEAGFPGALGLCFADLDMDGSLDIAATSETEGALKWWRNTGLDQPWPSHAVDTAIPDAWPLTAGDFNGDGMPDLAAGGGSGETSTVRTYTGDGQAGLEEASGTGGLSIHPNPSARGVTISSGGGGSFSGGITVYDIRGRSVWSFDGAFEGSSIYWPGTDSSGGRLPAGTYRIAGALSRGGEPRRVSVTLL